MRKILIFILLILLSAPLLGIAENGNQIEPIPVDQAFQFSASARDNQTIIARWNIQPGYYLYKERFHFSIAKPKGTRLGQPLMPASITHSTPGIGKYQVYEGELDIPIPVIQTKSSKLVLQATYQGCSSKGYCYPPTTKVVPINLASNYMQFSPGIAVDIPTTNVNAATTTTQSKIASLISTKNIFTFILSFLGFGILISLTPCVLPMIPILSGIIVGQKNITTLHAFLLSLAYVLGMALTYAIAGVIFGFIGASVQVAFQQPWIIVLFSLFFVAMALSLFGLYEIQLPEKWRSGIAHASQHQKGGTYLGAALMGCFSTLILSPCVTPPLVAVLGYISQTGNAAAGGIALFTMGIGMGVPLLLIGISHGKLIPKAGAWMNATRTILGILMLAVAVWMLERILPGYISMLLWAAIAIGTAIYMGALSTATTHAQRFFKGLGLIIFVYGIVLVIGASMGNTNPLAPISLSRKAHANELKFTPVKTVADVKKQFSLPANSNKIVMLDFYADWCISCKELDRFTFSSPQVQAALSNVTKLRADVTKNDIEDKRLERRYHVVAPPTILFFWKGKEIANSRIIGEMSAQAFLKHLRQVEQNK